MRCETDHAVHDGSRHTFHTATLLDATVGGRRHALRVELWQCEVRSPGGQTVEVDTAVYIDIPEGRVEATQLAAFAAAVQQAADLIGWPPT